MSDSSGPYRVETALILVISIDWECPVSSGLLKGERLDANLEHLYASVIEFTERICSVTALDDNCPASWVARLFIPADYNPWESRFFSTVMKLD